MIAALELFAYALLMVAGIRGCVWLFGQLETRATRRFQQRLAAANPQPADDTEETPMPRDRLTHAELARLRAGNEKLTAAVRQRLTDLAAEPDGDIRVLRDLIASNVYVNPIVVAGLAGLATLDLALAQAEIIRLRAELDGERAAHAACHADVRRATRGGA